jgi:hypothetical protein
MRKARQATSRTQMHRDEGCETLFHTRSSLGMDATCRAKQNPRRIRVDAAGISEK